MTNEYGSNRAHLWYAIKSDFLRLSAFLVLLLFCASGTAYAVVEDTGAQSQHVTEMGVLHNLISELSATHSTVFGQKQHEKGPQYREGELLVKFKQGVSTNSIETVHKRYGSEKIREFPSLRLHLVKFKRGQSVEEAISLYKADPAVEYAEPNYIVSAQTIPNDPDFSLQWALYNTGQTGGLAAADIKAPAAWNITTGSNSVVVATIDTGVDYTHQDLAANIWVNPGGIAGDGYTNDVHGINAITGSGDPIDDMGHGTHVAGIIGAAGNNSIGVAGVNWHVKILACKFLDSSGSGSIADAITCLQYVRTVKDSGVNIVATNNSWGFGGCQNCYSQALADAISAQKDILFIAAAGNSNANNDKYNDLPANYSLPNMISVAATDSSDNMASFSDYGKKSVDVGAPGVNILSTLPAQNYWNLSGGYGYLSGTSMSTPYVTGLAALLKAQDENRSWIDIKNLILSGGFTMDSMNNTLTGKRISAYGSLACRGNTAFGAKKFPAFLTVGTPETLSALSINCASPVGPVTVTPSSGQVINLHDDGMAPDLVSGDGIFSGTWTPSQKTDLLTFSSPAGTQIVEIPALTIIPFLLEGNIRSSYSYFLTAAGGLPPYTWSITSGSVPPGLSLNNSTGEISGQPTATGSFSFTVQVTDAFNMTATNALAYQSTDSNIVALWGEAAGNSKYGYLPDKIVADSNGNTYSTGYVWINSGVNTWGTSVGRFVIKYDPSGNPLWTKNFDTLFQDVNGYFYPTTWVGGIAADKSGNLYAGVNIWNGVKYVYGAIKYDPMGNILWEGAYDIGSVGLASNDESGGAVDANGNFYAAGSPYIYQDGQNDLILIKFSPSGNELWEKTFANGLYNAPRGVAVDASGNIYVTGITFWVDATGQDRSDFLTVKWDSSGNQLWAVRYNDGQSDSVWDIATDASGVYIVGYNLPSNSCIVKKYAPTGSELWTALPSPPCTDSTGLAADGKGYIYVSNLSGFSKYDSSGALLWTRSYGSGYAGSMNSSIAADNNGMLYTTGYFYDDASYDYDSATIKYQQVLNPPPPTIALNPASLAFTTTVGTNPANQTVALSNSGGGTLSWTATADSTSPAWLSVIPGSGAGNATLTVSVNSSGLAAGTYTKVITLTITGASNSPQILNVTLTVNPAPAATASAINAGGGQYTDTAGNVYKADTDYSGGSAASTTAAITGTSDGTLYQSERYGNFSYNIPLTNGNYNVTLKFAEIYWNATGQRIFNVSMQGTPVISNLDIYAKVGKNAAYDVTKPVSVTNGTLNINFTTVVDNAKVSAIEITGGAPNCTASAPTVSITPASQNITSGGSDTYTLSVTNNDSGTGCTSATFSLAASDTNSTNFNVSTASPASVTLSPGASGNSTLTVSAKAAQTSGTDSTTVTATASGHATGVSNAVTTTIDTTSIVAFAVNAGGAQYTDTAGNVYKADTDYSQGTTASTTASIAGTPDPTLYKSERYGYFSYNIPIANGNYNVTLKFAEIYWNAAGQRVFNVSMQGTQVISGLDIYSKVGKNVAYDVTIPVTVTNGVLNIAFASVVDQAKVSAIEVTPK